MTIIHAPFSAEVVTELVKYQLGKYVHPYTCKNGHTMVVSRHGFRCTRRDCNYTQDWAHDPLEAHDGQC